ncbi:MAG: hypothetical protein WC356_03810 [Candidatus Micrarchaeia archaeon]|jgi:hypothetical protein
MTKKKLQDLEPEELEKVLEEQSAEPETPEVVGTSEPEQTEQSTQTEPETQEEVVLNPYEQKFKELGLDKQYTSIDDMIERIPFYNKYTTQVAQENAQLKRDLEERDKRMRDLQTRRDEPDVEYDPNRFVERPHEYLDKRYPTRDEIAALQQRVQKSEEDRLAEKVERFSEKHPDVAQLQPFMMQLYQQDPGYGYLRDPLTALYRAAKEYVDTQITPTRRAVESTSKIVRHAEKERAQTTGTGVKPTSTRGVSPADLTNKSIEELEKMFGITNE